MDFNLKRSISAKPPGQVDQRGKGCNWPHWTRRVLPEPSMKHPVILHPLSALLKQSLSTCKKSTLAKGTKKKGQQQQMEISSSKLWSWYYLLETIKRDQSPEMVNNKTYGSKWLEWCSQKPLWCFVLPIGFISVSELKRIASFKEHRCLVVPTLTLLAVVVFNNCAVLI